MRKLILCVAMLALCGAVGGQQRVVTDGKSADDCKVLIATVTAEPCHLKNWQPKQEQKAQPDEDNFKITKGYVFPGMPLPFDVPAKEWDGPEQVAEDTCGDMKGAVGCTLPYIPVPVHHVSCKDVVPDWRERVLLDSADGKHHCFAFYLLEQKP